MRLAFMGTSEFAVPSLAALLAWTHENVLISHENAHEIVCVYTRSPAKAKRGQKLCLSPVHVFAEEMGLEVCTPLGFQDESERRAFAARNLDMACVVSYGYILPPEVLAMPRYGCLNLHASALPRWRGAAPIERAILAGDTHTAVQIIEMQAQLDTGPILLSESMPIDLDDNAGILHDKLAHAGAGLWGRIMAGFLQDRLTPRAQQGEVCYAHKIEKSETHLLWAQNAQIVARKIRAFAPRLGAWCVLPDCENNARLKVLRARVETFEGRNWHGSLVPGQILDNELLIACADTQAGQQGLALRLLDVQMAGKNRMSGADFARSRSALYGQVLS